MAAAPRAARTARAPAGAPPPGAGPRAVFTTKHGAPRVLEVQERPDPELGADQVRIDVAAAGVNFADVLARIGLYPASPKPPCVIGYEVAGTILELGPGVSGFTPRPRGVA